MARRGTGRWPNLFIVGAMKSGTTSLHAYLAAHPEICMSAFKEPSFFVDRAELRRLWPERADDPSSHDAAAYLRLFDAETEAAYLGESSTNYAKRPHVTRVPERIAAASPDARIVYLMRDPVARTISHYWHEVRRKREHRPMPQAIREEPQYRDISRYAMQLAPFLDVFGRERVLTLTTEELEADPRGTLRRVFAWLGVATGFAPPDLDARLFATPRQVVVWYDWPLLHRVRGSRLWAAVKPWTPERVRRLARAATSAGERTAADGWTAEVEALLRPAQQAETRELSALLGRGFPEWTRLYGTPPRSRA